MQTAWVNIKLAIKGLLSVSSADKCRRDGFLFLFLVLFCFVLSHNIDRCVIKQHYFRISRNAV